MTDTRNPNRPIRQLQVGNAEMEFFGVDTILEEFYLDGWSPDENGIEDAIVIALREEGNEIPAGVESGCAAALKEMFRRFCEESDEAAASILHEQDD